MAAERSLDDLLQRAREASPNERIELRDPIAHHGVAAIDAMSDWLADRVLCRFAVRVIGQAGQLGERNAAIRALVAAMPETDQTLGEDIAFELERLGYKLPAARKPSRPSWAKGDPYAVAPLSADAGLAWQGFRAGDFGEVTGTTWRRRNDPASLPPIILRHLREIHPHFSSWPIYGSAEVHFAITDRYRQFDAPESGWRAAKLIVYAHGPTAEEPDVVPQVVAGLYIEKGDGVDKGPVDATWDWPRFVTSLTDPAITQPLARVMEKHGLAMGDYGGQRFGSSTQIGGVGRMEGGEFIFRNHAGDELFRGFAAMRHHLEGLPANAWHDFHIWRSWPAEEAVDAGQAFAREDIVPVLEDLARIYIDIVRGAVAEGVRALHRVEERRERSDGIIEIVCLIQAQADPGHFTIPKRVADELGIGPDKPVQLSVETLENERYFSGVVSMRAGYEIYFRVNDPTTQGLDAVGGKEWLRITVSKPA